MKTPNVLEQPEYPNLPKCKNGSVGSISRDNIANQAWLAGIFDGEGTVGINGNNARGMGQLRWAVKNTSPEMIKRVSEILASWNVPFYYNYGKGDQSERYTQKTKESLTIAVSGMASIRRIMENIEPYLTAKKAEANLLLDYLKWRLDEMPFHSRNTDQCALLNKRRDETKQALEAMKRKR